jgi:hypothetical protein
MYNIISQVNKLAMIVFTDFLKLAFDTSFCFLHVPYDPLLFLAITTNFYSIMMMIP